MLLWVHSGAATVTVAGTAFALTSGEALWIPEGIDHHLCTTPDTLLFPVIESARHATRSAQPVQLLTVPPAWEPWLIAQCIDNTHLGPHLLHSDADPLLELLGPLHSQRQDGPDTAGLPTSPEASNVAEALLRTPDCALSLHDYARRERVSVKTLQRQFRTETSLTFSQWRSRTRVHMAAQLILDGADVGSAGRRVGFVTAAGFTKAFRAQFSVPPAMFLQRSRACAEQQATRRSASLSERICASPINPPPIPLRQTWVRVHRGHFLLWMARGNAQVTLGNRIVNLAEGEALWIPAHVPNIIEYQANSIAVPVGDSFAPIAISPENVEVFTFPAQAYRFLLHASVVEYTFMTAVGGTSDRAFTEQLLVEQLRTGTHIGASDGPGATLHAVLTQVRRDPGDERTLQQWAQHMDMPQRQLAALVRAQTGVGFQRWRAYTRMNQARLLLLLGETPSSAARRLGYGSQSSFSNAFTRAHAISPREFIRTRAGIHAFALPPDHT